MPSVLKLVNSKEKYATDFTFTWLTSASKKSRQCWISYKVQDLLRRFYPNSQFIIIWKNLVQGYPYLSVYTSFNYNRIRSFNTAWNSQPQTFLQVSKHILISNRLIDWQTLVLVKLLSQLKIQNTDKPKWLKSGYNLARIFDLPYRICNNSDPGGR